MKMKELLEQITNLCESGNISGAIELFENQDIDVYPTKPYKPYLSKEHTSYDASIYAKALTEYESQLALFKLEQAEYRRIKSELENHLVSCIKKNTCVGIVPEKYIDKLFSYAYEQSHSSGYYEVYSTLNDLVSIFY